jgi:hypothetical protein
MSAGTESSEILHSYVTKIDLFIKSTLIPYIERCLHNDAEPNVDEILHFITGFNVKLEGERHISLHDVLDRLNERITDPYINAKQKELLGKLFFSLMQRRENR